MQRKLLFLTLFSLSLLLLFSSSVFAGTVQSMYCFPDMDQDGFADGAPIYNGGLDNSDPQAMRRTYFNEYAFHYRFDDGFPTNTQVPAANSLDFAFDYNTTDAYIQENYIDVYSEFTMSSVLSILSGNNYFTTYNPSITCAQVATGLGITSSDVPAWIKYAGDDPNLQGGYDVPTCEYNYDGSVGLSVISTEFTPPYGNYVPSWSSDYYQYMDGQLFTVYYDHKNYTNLDTQICAYDCNDANPNVNPGISDSLEQNVYADLNCDGYQRHQNMCHPDADGDGLADPSISFQVDSWIWDESRNNVFKTPAPVENWAACALYGPLVPPYSGSTPCATPVSDDPTIQCNYVPLVPETQISSESEANPSILLYASQSVCEAAGFEWTVPLAGGSTTTVSVCSQFTDAMNQGNNCVAQDTCYAYDDCTGTFSCEDIVDQTACDFVQGCSYSGTSCSYDPSELSDVYPPMSSATFLDCVQHQNANLLLPTSSSCDATIGCSELVVADPQFPNVDYYFCVYDATEAPVIDQGQFAQDNQFLCEAYFQSGSGQCASTAPTSCAPSGSTYNGYYCSQTVSRTVLTSGYCYSDSVFISSLIEPPLDCDDADPTERVCPPPSSTVCLVDNDNDGFYVIDPTCPTGSMVVAQGTNPPIPDTPGDPLRVDNIPGWAAAVGNSGYIYDADDNDWDETYLNCPAGSQFVYPASRLVQSYSSDDDYAADLNDAPYHPKYFGGCCSSGECLQYNIITASSISIQSRVGKNNQLCVSSETNSSLFSTIAIDDEVVCAPALANLVNQNPVDDVIGFWLDGDSDQYVCEDVLGHTWTASGHTTDANRLAVSPNNPFVATPPVEYDSSKTRLECCGDDGENLVTATCDGSSTATPLCAPDNLNTYKISNGDLVLADSCPDITRSGPVFLESSYVGPANWNAFDMFLQGQSSDTYCCDASRINDPNYPLCTSTTVDGCFIADMGLNIPVPTPSVEWCVQSGPDSNCVIDGSYLGTQTNCADETLLNQRSFEVSTVTVSDANMYDLFIVQDFTVVDVVTQYTTLASSCSFSADTVGCQQVTINTCTLADGAPNSQAQIVQGLNPANEFAFCDIDTNSPFDPAQAQNCKIYGTQYTCKPETVLVGSACTITPTCVETVTVTVQQVDVLSASNFSSVSMNDPQFYVGQDTFQFDSDPQVTLSYVDTTSTTSNYCQTINYQAGTNYCLPAGTQVNISGNVVVCGDSQSQNQNFGDYWCPPGYEYDSINYHTCVPAQFVCEAGPVGQTQCADITSANDDGYFSQYADSCVGDGAAPGNLYDEACCLAAVFNNFEIYEQLPQNVRVY